MAFESPFPYRKSQFQKGYPLLISHPLRLGWPAWLEHCGLKSGRFRHLFFSLKNILLKNQKLEDKVFTLIGRLERLEKVALKDPNSKDLAVHNN